MKRIVGYADRLSVRPAEAIEFKVSCDAESYVADLVRLIHGDANPAGPGFKAIPTPSSLDGTYRGHRHAIRAGSYGRVDHPDLTSLDSFTVTCWLAPTTPDRRGGVISTWIQRDNAGFALLVEPPGFLTLYLGDGTTTSSTGTGVPLERGEWHFVAAGYDSAARQVFLHHEPLPSASRSDGAHAVEPAPMHARPPQEAPLILGALMERVTEAGPTLVSHLNGRLDDPRVFGRALSMAELRAVRDSSEPSELPAGLIAGWDLGLDPASDDLADVSGRGVDGRLINLPTRAVCGHRWSGREVCYRLAPSEYSAAHFHEDDIDDLAWPTAFSLKLPSDMETGIYAVRVRAGGDDDYIPFFVRPTRPTSQIAYLIPTLTYRVYANYLDVEGADWNPASLPNLKIDLNKDVYEYIVANGLAGLYDRHVDGSARCYGSSRRPILNMRPTWRNRIWDGPSLFAADLYLVDWLDHFGYAVDIITDDDLQAEGRSLLSPYEVVLTGSHPEYWTSQMLEGLSGYLSDGGRLMYLGGNGFYGVTSVDPERPYVAEVRRWGTSWPFEAPPAERYHSTTGEAGGTWRNRGLASNRVVGVGSCAAGFDEGTHYVRQPDSSNAHVGFVFEGLADDERIGDCPSLVVRHGAGGYEIDRYDASLGSPTDAYLLASTVGHSERYVSLLDEQMWFVDAVDGLLPASPPASETDVHPYVRADIVLCPYPNGGAVFSVGSIAWNSCLSYDDYASNVSRITRNVLERFLIPEPLEPRR